MSTENFRKLPTDPNQIYSLVKSGVSLRLQEILYTLVLGLSAKGFEREVTTKGKAVWITKED